MPTLSDQLSVPDSPDLRDLLKAHNSRRRRRGGGGDGEGEVLTLASVLASEKRDMAAAAAPAAAAAASASAPGGRTLLDVLRDEEGVLDGSSGDGLRWRDLLRLRRAGAVSARSISARAAEILHPESGTILEAIVSEYRPPAAAGAPPDDSAAGGVESADGGGSAEAATEEQPVRPSLMALLEQAEWQTGSEGGGGGRVAPAAVGVEVGEWGMHMCWCCVCMVRQKGAAFIPCGHTFCRACSRELWVRRGSCPLCNAAVLDILDIY